MSSIRAVSETDEMLAEEPEETRPSDVQSVSPEPLRRLRHIRSSKFLSIGGIILLALMLTGSLVTLAVMASQLSDLTVRVHSLDAAFRSGQIGKLSSSVASMEEITLRKDTSGNSYVIFRSV